MLQNLVQIQFHIKPQLKSECRKYASAEWDEQHFIVEGTMFFYYFRAKNTFHEPLVWIMNSCSELLCSCCCCCFFFLQLSGDVWSLFIVAWKLSNLLLINTAWKRKLLISLTALWSAPLSLSLSLFLSAAWKLWFQREGRTSRPPATGESNAYFHSHIY